MTKAAAPITASLDQPPARLGEATSARSAGYFPVIPPPLALMYAVDDNTSLSLPFPDMTHTSRAGPVSEPPAFWSLSQPHQNINHRCAQRGPSKLYILDGDNTSRRTEGYCLLRCCSPCRLKSVLVIFAVRLFQRAC